MKKIYIAFLMGMGILTSSCSDFLDREPLTVPNNYRSFRVNRRYADILTVCTPHFPLCRSLVWACVEKIKTATTFFLKFTISD